MQNPKEDPYSKVIVSNYEKAQILQEEKIGLVEKAAALVRAPIMFFMSPLTITTVGPPRKATRYQAPRPAKRWVHTF